MTKRRILSMTLVGCMLSAMMTACGGNSSSTDSSASGGGTTSTTKRDDGIFELNSDVFSKPNSDPGSAPGSDPGSKPDNSTDTTSKVTQPTYQQVENLDDLKSYERDVYQKLPELKTDVEKKLTILYNSEMSVSPMLTRKYGVSMETVVVPNAEMLNRYIAMVNADTPPDILVGNYNYTLISRGYVQAWDSYVDLKGSTWKDELPYMENYAVANKHYLFVPKDPNAGGHLMYVIYNAETIRENNLQSPGDLFAQNKWDWDAMANIAEKMTGNGRYGIAFYNGPQAFVNSTGHDYVDFVNGKAQNMLKNVDVTRAIQAYSDLVSHKAIYTGGNELEMLRRGNLAMAVGSQGGIMALKDEILAGKVGFTAFPRDPKKNDYYMPYMGNGFYLAKGAKHPNNAVAFMTTWHYEADSAYKAALNKELVSQGLGTPEIIFNNLQAIDSKVKGTLQTWELFGSEATVYISALGTGLNAGSPWSLLSSELSPLLDDGIRTFYGG